jgi:sugar-specific transcriptional regulator TrmB
MKKLVDSARKFGLNEYEARAYVALSSLGSSPVSSLSKIAEIPRARVYDVLASLEKKGFAVKKPVKPAEYSALHPSEAFKHLEKRKNDELKSELAELDEIRKSLEHQLSFGSTSFSEADNVLLVVEGRNNIYSKIDLLLNNAKESVFIASSKEGIERKKVSFGQKLSSLRDAGINVSFKHSSVLNSGRFLVFDKELVLMFLNSEIVGEKQEKALLVQSPFLANFICSQLKAK